MVFPLLWLALINFIITLLNVRYFPFHSVKGGENFPFLFTFYCVPCLSNLVTVASRFQYFENESSWICSIISVQ